MNMQRCFLLISSRAHLLLTMGDFRLLSVPENAFLASSFVLQNPRWKEYPLGVVKKLQRGNGIENMLAYYCNGLAFGKWRKPLELRVREVESKGASGLIEGTLNSKSTVVYGGQDLHFINNSALKSWMSISR